MAERSDAPLADEPQGGAVPNDMPLGESSDAPSGLPADEQEQEEQPGGPEDAHPESVGGPGGPGEDVDRGKEAQPGIPEGEPPASA